MHEALYYEHRDGTTVQCHLCPHECVIATGGRGRCGVRRNDDGTLVSLIYGMTTSVALDPIEKKPLYHYHPGEHILSLGTAGCNFCCAFCQNWSISQDPYAPAQNITPAAVVAKAKELGSFGIAYTYNEPFIWYEFVIETARRARREGLENVLVTNGFVNQKPLEDMLPLIGAMNIDIKSIDDDFYRTQCGGRVQPVLDTIVRAHRACHVELTNLIIPTLNDSPAAITRLVDWIADSVGPDVPLHFSRYFPCYKMTLPPTPAETLATAQRIAQRKLRYVHLGNV